VVDPASTDYTRDMAEGLGFELDLPGRFTIDHFNYEYGQKSL
jgi:hypothetical protein